MKLDMHDTPMMMLIAAFFVSLVMSAITMVIESWPGYWPLLFFTEAGIAGVLMSRREKQLETLGTVKEE